MENYCQIEITGIPITETTAEGYIYPAAAAALRLEEADDYIEQRFIKNGDGVLQCFIRLPEILRDSVATELKRSGYSVKKSSSCKTYGFQFILSRKYMKTVRTNRGTSATFSYELAEIESSEFRSGAAFSLLQTMPCEAGFSLIIGSQHVLDTKDFHILNNILCKQSEPDEDGVLSKLAKFKTVFPAVFSCFSQNEKSSLKLARELCYTFSGLNYSKTKSDKSGGELLRECLENAAKEIFKFAYYYTFEETNRLADMRGLRGRYGIRYNKASLFLPEFPADMPTPELEFGKGFDTDTGTENGIPVGIPLNYVCKHIFLGGAPGSGKGNLLFSIAEQLFSRGINFLMIESAKSEMHHLSKKIGSLKVWRPMSGEFVLNPFSLPKGVTLGEYRANLNSILKVFVNFEHTGSMEDLMLETLRICFSSHGYTDDSMDGDEGTTPFGLNEFMGTYRTLLENKAYSSDTGSDMKTAGLNRLQALFNENKAMYDSVRSIPISELLSGYNLLQLNCLTTPASKQLFATILLISIGAWLKLKMKNEDNSLKLVIILDESHNLLKGVENSKGGIFSFADDFLALLLEMRSLGVGFIVADQSCNNLPPDMAAACATKIFLGGNIYSGIDNFSTEFGMNSESFSKLYLLDKGEGCFHTYGMPVGATFRTPHIIGKYKVNEHCDIQNKFLGDNPRYVIETFAECKTCLGHEKCTLECKAAASRVCESIFADISRYLNRQAAEKDLAKLNDIKSKYYKIILDRTKDLDDITLTCCIKQLERCVVRDYGKIVDANILISWLKNKR